MLSSRPAWVGYIKPYHKKKGRKEVWERREGGRKEETILLRYEASKVVDTFLCLKEMKLNYL